MSNAQTIYSARWLHPISSPLIENGALLIERDGIVAVGSRDQLISQNPKATVRDFGNAIIIPGLVNSHSHLELTVMRGFLDSVEGDFTAWLKKLTLARLQQLTVDDLYVSAAWGACEAARAGVTCLGDSSDSGATTMRALLDVGLRGIVFQESFGPDPKLVRENFGKLTEKVARVRELEDSKVHAGVSPHAPYTVCADQLEMIADYALAEDLPLMMHAAESVAEEQLLRQGSGPFAEGLKSRNIEWSTPGTSTIKYLEQHEILKTKPLLAHCINVDQSDLELLKNSNSAVAHCPRSNAKLGHRRAPFAAMLKQGIAVGLGSDSVASNNSCDLLAEARFAILSARSGSEPGAELVQPEEALHTATLGGARAMHLGGRIGELREGLQADFAVVSLDGSHQLPSYDPVNTLMFASSGHDVVCTVVGGKEIYANGRVITVDEDRLRARVSEIQKKLSSN
jgi:cytosine/adenosine deaminase-related metal-dependent hydrolase